MGVCEALAALRMESEAHRQEVERRALRAEQASKDAELRSERLASEARALEKELGIVVKAQRALSLQVSEADRKVAKVEAEAEVEAGQLKERCAEALGSAELMTMVLLDLCSPRRAVTRPAERRQRQQQLIFE